MLKSFVRTALILGAVLCLVTPNAVGQTWTGGAGTGDWNTGANWSPSGVPTSSNITDILLNGTVQPNTIQNIPGIFTLRSLTLGAAGATSSFTVSGNPLEFAGSGANITLADYAASGPVTNQLRVDSAISFSTATSINLLTSADLSVVGYELSLKGTLSGSGNVTIAGDAGALGISDVLLAGRNGTMTGSVTINTSAGQTFLYLADVNALGRGVSFNTGTSTFTGVALASFVNTFAGVTTEAGYNQQLGNITGSAGLNIGSFSTAFVAQQSATLAVGFANADATYAGVIRYATTSSHIAKVGTGVFTNTASMGSLATLLSDLSVRDGRYQVSGAGTFGSTSGSPTGASSLRIYAGAEFRAVTGTATGGRVQNTTAINLAGGIFRLDASGLAGSGTGYSDPTGQLRAIAGQSTVAVDTNSARNSRWSFSSLSTTPGSTATIFFVAKGLGANATTSGVDSGNVNFGTAPSITALVGTTTGYLPTGTDLRILPYGFAAIAITGSPGDYTGVPETFVAYDNNNGGSLRGLATGNYNVTLVAANNVSLGAAETMTSNIVVNSLRLTSGGSVNISGNDLTFTSGAILNNGGGNITNTGLPANLIFPINTATTNPTAFITTNGAMTIDPTIVASNLSKNGAGNLTINAQLNMSGTAAPHTIAVNAGTLTFSQAVPVTAGTISSLTSTNTLTYQVLRGATLVVASGLTIGTNMVLQGGGTAATPATVAGTLTVASGGVIRASALGGSSASLASPGTLTVAGDMIWETGGTYQWYVNSAITNGDNTVAATVGTLANYRSPYTSSLLTISGTLNLTGLTSFTILPDSLLLSNADGSLYDFNSATETRSWVIVEAGAITGFDAAAFNFGTSEFNPGTAFFINQVGNSLVLTALPVPEPASILLVCVLVLGMGILVRRRVAVVSA